MNLSKAKCPVCGSSSYSDFLKATCPRTGNFNKYYNLIKCNDCSLVYLNPLPLNEEFIDVYHSGYEDEWGSSRSLKQKLEYFLVKRLPCKPPGKLLDIGCGTGQYISVMEEKGWDVTGVDPWAKNYKGKKIHPSVISTDLSSANFKPESFDVVTMWWVIEHYMDPVAELRLIRKTIKSDGLLAISTCNISSFEAKFFGRFWHHLMLPDHCVHLSPDVLARCLREAGFEPIKIKNCLLTASFIGSLNGILRNNGVDLNLLNPFVIALGSPFEIAASMIFRNSGLYTVFAKPINSKTYAI